MGLLSRNRGNQLSHRVAHEWKHRLALGSIALVFAVGLVLPLSTQASALTIGSAKVISGTTELDAIACTSATTCVAVGSLCTTVCQGIVVPITNGAQGTVAVVPGTNYFNAVACTSSYCVAVGDNPSSTQGVLDLITNGTPGTAEVVSGSAYLLGIACASTTICVADGVSTTGPALVVPLFNGFPISTYTIPGTTQLWAVACTSATSCLVAGIYETSTVLEGVVVTITGVGLNTPGHVKVIPAISELYSVACASATTCAAVGTGSTTAAGVMVPVTSGDPGTAQFVSGTASLEGIACPSATICIAVGTNAFGINTRGVVLPVSSGASGTPKTVSGTMDLLGVTCTSSSDCVATGGNATNGKGVVVPISTKTATSLVAYSKSPTSTFVRAKLTVSSGGAPLAGKGVAFISSAGRVLCQDATTNASGIATCGVSSRIYEGSTYTASYGGSSRYLKSSGKAGL